MRAYLLPFGALFGGLAALRAALYRSGLLPQARLAHPVISVGNLSVGGTGKTPVVARIAGLLRDQGLDVAILSRGYKGRFRGEVLVVSDGERLLATADLAGDEPVMLARGLPGVVVAVGPRRDVVGRWVDSRYGPRVHVLDDGFQHLRLARDLDLLCIDALEPEGWPMPAGRLREFDSAARRADVVLLTHAGDATEATLRRLEDRFGAERTFRVHRRIEGFFDQGGRPCAAPERPFLLAGIARPERFEGDVRARAGEPVGRLIRRDHHAWSGEEIEQARLRARDLGADALVTTAKDAARIPEASAALPPPILVLRIAAEIRDHVRLEERLLPVARGATSREAGSRASRKAPL